MFNRAIIPKILSIIPDDTILTRTFVICYLYYLDKKIKPGCLEVEWQIQDVYYPMSKEITQSFDELGCLRPLKATYHNDTSFRDNVENKLSDELKEAFEIFTKEISSYSSYDDFAKLKSAAIKIMISERKG